MRAGERRAGPLLLAMLGVALVLASLYAVNHRFFFFDDRQIQYFPYGLIIKDALLHGEFPFTTIRTLYGGALWLDVQYGLYNPLSLFMTLLINPRALEFSGFLSSLVLCLLLAGGTYTLGRAYGLKAEFAAVLGLVTGTNVYMLYFHANTWQPGLSSLIWLAFAWASLKRLTEVKKAIALRVLKSAVFIFLTVSAGWPHQYVALAVILTVLFVEEWHRDRQRALRLVYATALGAAFCLPVLIPVAAGWDLTARPRGFFNNGLMAPGVGDMLNFSNPAWLPRLLQFSGTRVTPAPYFFAAWFALPALFFVKWRGVDWKKYSGLAAALGLFALLTLSAEQAGPLRWPVRWIADVHLCLLLGVLLILQRENLSAAPPRLALALSALGVTTLAAVMESPPQALAALWLALLPALFIPLLAAAVRNRGGLPFLLGASSVVMMTAMAPVFPDMPLFFEHGKSDTVLGARAAPDGGGEGYALYWWPYDTVAGLKDERDFLFAGMGGYYNVNTINGYSSIGYKGLSRVFRRMGLDFSSPAKPRLTVRDRETGAMFLDLLKIRKIVAGKSVAPDDIGKTTPGVWTRGAKGGLVTFERREKFGLPGTVSWRSPAIALEGGAEAEANGESAGIRNSGLPGLVVFARLYYPGFHATLDGAPLKVRPVGKMLVGVEVPAQAAGTLRLFFRPPLFYPCLALSGLALLVWACFALTERKRRTAGSAWCAFWYPR